MTGTPSVLVVGDANPDLVLRGDTVPRFGQAEQLLDAADLTLGGSAAIVASGIATLGTPVRLVARVGDDLFGRAVLDALAARHVDTGLVATDPSVPSGLSVILADPAGDRAILTLPGTIPTLDVTEIPDAVLRDVAHVHVASYFLQPRLAHDLPGLLQRAREAGCTTSLDTNWDPSGRWSGVTAALPLVDVFLPNAAELVAVSDTLAGRERSPGPRDLLDRARELQRLGPVVAVKAGADGGWAVTADAEVSAPGLPVDVVDTTGAGDSFDAGFIAAWVRGRPVAECLRWATVAGSLSTRAPGGTGAQATLAELEARAGSGAADGAGGADERARAEA